MLYKLAGVLVVVLLATLSGCAREQQRVAESISTAPALASLPIDLDADSIGDGTPDFLRLDTEADREAFRKWFTFLAEVQYFNPPAHRPVEITDCASLLRYAYREALRSHDSAWAAASNLPVVPAFPSIRKYAYPYTPLRASLFRRREGPFTQGDLHNGAFAQFANAETLERFDTFLAGHDVEKAQAGDLLFYRHATDQGTAGFHSMIVLGRSEVKPSVQRYVVYDTGAEGSAKGEIRRLDLSTLLTFPDPQWRPYAANPHFLGVFRWNILRDPK